MIRALDRNVGLVLDALKANGLDDNTLVIFTSDNGGADYIGLPDINKPFRGWKATFFEGGIHVPFFIRWPGQLAKGSKFDKPVGHVDIFATAAAAAAASDSERSRHGWRRPAAKFVTTRPRTRRTRRCTGATATTKCCCRRLEAAGRGTAEERSGCSISTRIRPRKKNLAEAMPDKVAELQSALASVDAEQVKPLWPTLLEAPVRIDTPGGQRRSSKDEEYIYWAN